jgi:uncharacterized protein (TIGR01777 family)
MGQYPHPIATIRMNTQFKNEHGGRYLLSGASGMLGSALRQALNRREAELIQLVRRNPEASEELRWDPHAPSPVAQPQALDGLDAAIHLSGANLADHRWTPQYLREVTASRVDSTRAMATMLARLRRPPQSLLVASAVGIYGNRGDEVLNETCAAGSGLLADLCREWEAAAAPAADAGIRVVHLRFGVVLAARSGALAKMVPIFRLGVGGRLGSGKQWMSWISVTDLVAATLFVLDSGSLTGPVNLTSPQPVTNAEFTLVLARVLHRPAMLPAPAFALRIALGRMADEALLSSTRAVPAKLLNARFPFAHASIDDALAEALGRTSP